MKEERQERVEPVKKGVDVQRFKARKLKAINNMSDQAKARAVADRILRNK